MIQLDGYAIKRNLTLEDYSTDLGESLSATASQTWIENPTSAISRLLELNQATGTYEPGVVGDFSPEKAILNWNTKDKAEQKAKDAGVDLKFSDVGIGQEKLDILIQRKREEVKRKATINMGPKGFLPGAAQIGTSLAVSIADPLNVASAFIPIVSQANQARLAARLGKTGGRLATGAVEGAVGAAIIEPIVYTAMKAEQADYDLYDSYMNVVFGAVIGGGLHASLGAIGDAISRSPAQTKSDLLQAATGQALDNKPVDISWVASEYRIIDPYKPFDLDANKEAALRDEVTNIRAELSILASQKMSRGQRKKIAAELRELEFKKKEFEDLSGPKLKKLGIKKKEALIDINAKIDRLNKQLDNDAVFREAEADISRLDQDVASEVFIEKYRDRIEAKIGESVRFNEIKPIQKPIKQLSNEADPNISAEYQSKLSQKPQETPDTVDSLTDDILTSLDETGVDTAEIRAELAETNKQIARESNGLREAVMCMIG